MLRRPDGLVSLLAHFPSPEVREAARALASLLDGLDVVMTLDVPRGNLELAQVRGVDLHLLTEWLRHRGARGVFVRYQHEGWPGTPMAGSVSAAPLN